jgi:hypothetical protein
MLSPTEIDELVALVESYRLRLHEFQKSKTACARIQVEMRSREALVVWVAYCLTYHAAGAQQHPLVKDYGVALNWQDMQHFVLGDKKARLALQGTAHLYAYQIVR